MNVVAKNFIFFLFRGHFLRLIIIVIMTKTTTKSGGKILQSLLKSSHNGKLDDGAIKSIRSDIHVLSKSLGRINRADYGNSGKTRKNRQLVLNKMKEISRS